MAYSSSLPLVRLGSQLYSDAVQALTLVQNRFRQDRLARRTILVLLALNLGLILLPIVLELLERAGVLTQVSRPMLNPSTDRSLPEMGNYLQTAVCVLALAFVAVRTGSGLALAWSLVFAFVLADDSLEYHEAVGAWLAGVFSLPAVDGLRSVDLGELMAWALAGAVLFPALGAGFWRASGVERGVGLLLASLFGLLVVFGIGVDMIHVAFPSEILALVEDSGEMFAIALAAGVSLLWARPDGSNRHASS